MKAMSSTVAVALWIAASCVPCTSEAALFKCVGTDGSITYQAIPSPDTGNEKKMKEPPAGPAGAGKSPSPWKEGWSGSDITQMADGCVPGVIGPAKRDFAARAAKAPDATAEFPEAELTAGVKAMCLCFAKRAGATYSRADFQHDRQAILRRMNDEAMNGGACKPEGMLGEVMEKSRQQ